MGFVRVRLRENPQIQHIKAKNQHAHGSRRFGAEVGPVLR